MLTPPAACWQEEGEAAEGGASSSKAKPKKATKAKAKAATKKAEGAPKRKMFKSRGGDRASVAPGGRGFKCAAEPPHTARPPRRHHAARARRCPVCDTFFDTASEALEHAAEACGFVSNGPGGRFYDGDGKTRCLWDGW